MVKIKLQSTCLKDVPVCSCFYINEKSISNLRVTELNAFIVGKFEVKNSLINWRFALNKEQTEHDLNKNN